MRLNFNAETTTTEKGQMMIIKTLSDVWGKEHHIKSQPAQRYIYSNTGLTTLAEWLSAKGIPSTFKVIGGDGLDTQVATILDIEENSNFTKLLLAA
jgi:hypothetical protein